jgi:hypothetical protein
MTQRAYRYLAALLLITVTVGCSPGLPKGINYVSEKQPEIVLNQLNNQWKLLIDGKDMTAVAGLQFVPRATIDETLMDFQLANAQSVPLPSKFSLQLKLNGPLLCNECSLDRHNWTRHEVK